MFVGRLLSSNVLSTSASTVRLSTPLLPYCFLYNLHMLGLYLLRLFRLDMDYRICRPIILHRHMAASCYDSHG